MRRQLNANSKLSDGYVQFTPVGKSGPDLSNGLFWSASRDANQSGPTPSTCGHVPKTGVGEIRTATLEQRPTNVRRQLNANSKLSDFFRSR